MENDPVHERLRLAIALADEVAPRVMRVYRPSGVRHDLKADGTPVTVADRDAESHIRQRVERLCPGDGFLGEEFGETAGNTGFRWVVDPIDGTKAFIAGVPLFGTLIGLERNGRSVAGVLHLPAVGEMLYAAASEGCWHRQGEGEPSRARVSAVGRLADAVVTMSSPGCLVRNGMAGAFAKLAGGCRMLRGWGDCFGYALVATGRAEVALDHRVAPWDVAALFPIISEAGGTITDWSGVACPTMPNCLATNGRVHAEVLATMKPDAAREG